MNPDKFQGHRQSQGQGESYRFHEGHEVQDHKIKSEVGNLPMSE